MTTERGSGACSFFGENNVSSKCKADGISCTRGAGDKGGIFLGPPEIRACCGPTVRLGGDEDEDSMVVTVCAKTSAQPHSSK